MMKNNIKKIKGINMKLKVVTHFWSVGNRTKCVGSKKYKLGEEPINFGLHALPATAVLKDETVYIEVRNYANEIIKKIEIKKGGKSYYRPFSMDAGYEFTFKLSRF